MYVHVCVCVVHVCVCEYVYGKGRSIDAILDNCTGVFAVSQGP